MTAATTLLSTVTLPEFTDLVEKDFVMTQQLIVPVAEQIFIYSDESANTGNTRRYDEVDTETYASLKREGENAVKSKAGVGYNKTLVAKRIAKEINITFEMRRYNKKPEVIGELTSLRTFCSQRTELDLSHRLTFCDAVSYVDMDGETVDITGGDGLAVVDTAHTLAFSTNTWSNRVAGDPTFDASALEAAERLTVTDIVNNFGERRVMNFNYIITSDDPETCNEVRRVLESTAQTDQAQGNPGVINTYQGAYMHIKLPYLATDANGFADTTKRKRWFIGALNQNVRGFQSYIAVFEPTNLKTPAAGNNGEDVHNDNWTYGTRKSYGIATVSGRGLIGSLPVA